MERLNLAGVWTLREETSGRECAGHLPGCNYLDLLHNEIIEDPFWGQNEKKYTKLAEEDYRYIRQFSLTRDFLAQPAIDLVVSGLDTLAVVFLNGKQLAQTDNCHRTYRLPIHGCARMGENTLEILFKSPLPYLRERQKADPMFSSSEVKGVPHLRKVQCHFGWDWGPTLPPVGIFGTIHLEAYDARIAELQVLQQHQENRVELQLLTELCRAAPGMQLRYRLTHPDGRIEEDLRPCGVPISIAIENPQLWWCNGLGEQPLYQIELALLDAQLAVVDVVRKTVGLRTIRLNTEKDKWGGQFRFEINGIPIFAKGANWIPTDSFVTRTTKEDLRFYIESAKDANINMLRVWGGGHYESDAFYDLCDKNGILVWQDFAFACGAYPFYDTAFLETVKHEVADNVRRIRHHASLALWCGNNENELFAILFKRNKRLYETNLQFYFNTLREWVVALDLQTQYWPGSPSSGKRGIKPHHMNHGDNHLWQVWHGLMPIEAFRKMPARFCSEFGVESFPSMRAVRAFTKEENPDMLSPVMLTHQKSKGGNQKILFYLLAKYRNPSNFEDFAYLSQLVQANAIRFATDTWRRKRGRCNGSLYWQYNDCWPVASWAGIDYCKQYKALQYHARQFNKPVCLSNDYFRDRAEIYLANDLPSTVSGKLEWVLYDFHGNCISNGSVPIQVAGLQSKRITTLRYQEVLHGAKKEAAVLQARVYQGDVLLDQKNWLLVPDKYAKLQKPNIAVQLRVQDGIGDITLQSDVFARYVRVEVDAATAPFSDNFFDILGGGMHRITVPLPADATAAEIQKGIQIKTLADVAPKNSMFLDRLKRFSMRFQKINFVTWVAYKFIK